MAQSNPTRDLYRIIRKHVSGQGSARVDYERAREALAQKIGREKLPNCIRRHTTLAKCNKYLRTKGGPSVSRRLKLLKKEFDSLLKPAPPAPPPQSKADAPSAAPPKPSGPEVFISHSSEDEALVRTLIDLLRDALDLPGGMIRATSVDGYKLTGGAEVDRVLRREVVGARALVALLTASSLRSPYVLFELGARWGHDQGTVDDQPTFVPLLGGLEPRQVPAPLSALHLIDLRKEAQVHQFVGEAAKILGRPLMDAARFVGRVKQVVAAAAAAAPAVLSSKERRVIRALFGEPKGRSLKRYVDRTKSYADTVSQLSKQGLLEKADGDDRLRLTAKGEAIARAYLQSL